MVNENNERLCKHDRLVMACIEIFHDCVLAIYNHNKFWLLVTNVFIEEFILQDVNDDSGQAEEYVADNFLLRQVT